MQVETLLSNSLYPFQQRAHAATGGGSLTRRSGTFQAQNAFDYVFICFQSVHISTIQYSKAQVEMVTNHDDSDK